MKKSIIFGMFAVGAMMLTGCDDFLNDNRYPQSQQVVNAEFWSNTVNVENQCNHFYNNFKGYGSASGQGTFYFQTLNDDQAGTIGSTFCDWTYTAVPPTAEGYWDSYYDEIRRANLIIEGVASGTLNGTPEGNNYTAIARLNRAIQYFELVKRYGDVPLVKIALDVNDDAELYGPRTPRNEVMDFAIEDLDFAITNLTTEKSKTEFSQDLAKAVKMEVCLFEGSYAKYHQKDSGRATTMFNKVIAAAADLLPAYPVGDNYQALYNSFIDNLAANDEVIFMKGYVKDVFMHSLLDWTCSSSSVCGMTKDAFDSYLFLDGQPLLKQADQNDAGVAVVDGDNKTVDISGLLAVRDKRLAQTIDPNLMYTNMTYSRPNTMNMVSRSGYGICKYDNLEVPYDYATVANKAYTCAPLYWGARVVLDYLEARAETDALTGDDVTNYLTPIFTRAGLPAPTLAYLDGVNDPANDMGVSSRIWEIRRCRRCEFMFDGLRYWDLVRWHQLELLDFDNNPDITLGANVSTSPVQAPSVNGNYIDCSGGLKRKFTEREYFWPIPSDQLTLNPALTQNEGWK